METDVDMDSDLDSKDSFFCAMCSRHFSTKIELKQHFLSTHKGKEGDVASSKARADRKFNRYLCKVCGKHFADPWSLNHHWKSVHTQIREHRCSHCTKEFLSNKDMLRHYKGVHLKEKIIYPRSKQKPTITKFKISHSAIETHEIVGRIPNILKS